MEGGVEDRVGDQINRPDAGTDNRPDLAGVASRLPISGIEAKLEIDAIEEASFCRVWDDELGA